MPKTPPRPQWRVRLDGYHRFVVRRLKEATGADRAAVLERMVVQWVADHGDQVRQARASLEDWERVRQDEQEEEDEAT